MAKQKAILDAETLLGFSGAILSARYDDPKPTPACHLEWWKLCCSKHKYVSIAAPRGHSKTTAITQAYGLGCALFQTKQNIMILSDKQEQAIQFLGDIKMELEENDLLKETFDIKHIIRNKESEIIVELGSEGHLFRMFARGSEQSLRGSKWRGMRPDLIIIDDCENEELVSNPDRRRKLKQWMLGTLLPSLSDTGQIRMVGTILHLDSLLEWTLNSPNWKSARYEAHNDDFSKILWPEKWSKERLLAERAIYEEAGELEIYLQEYRNIPIDDTVAMFRQRDFLPIKNKDEHLEYYISVDCAVSKKQRADFTVFLVVGVNKDGKIKVVDIVRSRMDGLEIAEAMFDLEARYKPEMFIFEEENISRSIGPFLYEMMPKKKSYPIIEKIPSTKDLMMRVKSWTARMRAGGVEFDKDADWYADFYTELKQFPRGKHDDQVSACALMGMKLQALVEATTPSGTQLEDSDDYDSDDEYYFEDTPTFIYSSVGY